MIAAWDVTPPSERRLTHPTEKVREVSAPPKLPATGATTETATKRYMLPKNLPNAVKHLSDGELALMHAATLEKMKRRGKIPQDEETELRPPVLTSAKIQPPQTKKRRHVDITEDSIELAVN